MTEYRFSTSALPRPARKLVKAVICVLAEEIADHNQLYEFDLALTEACANVVKHAYKGETGDLDIILSVESNEYVELHVIDTGKGLNPAKLTIRNPHPEAESGRGMFIISELMDSFELKSEDGKNSLSFKKTIEGKAWKTCR